MGSRRSELVRRVVTAAVGIPILLAIILNGGALYTAVVAVLLAIGAGEIFRAAGVRWTDPLALAGEIGVAAVAVVADRHPDARWAVLAGIAATALAIVVIRAEVEHGFARWTAVMGGAMYLGVLGSHLVLLRTLEDGRAWVLLMLFTTFATDTGAFFIGRAFGRHKLAPRVSPGKTIVGALGGLAAAAAAAAALSALLGLQQHPAAMLGLGVLVAVAAELGDLSESLLKRSLGVKDLGRLFPGHGGVLDRMDSILFAAPVVYYLVRWIVE